MNAVLTALVNGLIVSAVMTAALWFVTELVSKRSWNAATRYIVWWTALLITIVMPLLYTTGRPESPSTNGSHDTVAAAGMGNEQLLPRSDQKIQSADKSASPRAFAVVPPFAQTARTTPASIRGVVRPLFPIEFATGRWTGWIFSIWAIAATLMLFRLTVSYIMLERRKTGVEAPAAYQVRLDEWLVRCGAGRRKIRLAFSKDITAPIAAGPYRPSILFPHRIWEALSEDQLNHVGLHEAAHFRRRDDFALIFQRIIEAVFVFHPVVQWIARRIDFEREVACDDFVVQITGSARRYAVCLTRVAELANGTCVVGPAASATEPRSHLETRVEMLLDSSRKTSTCLLKSPLIGAVSMLSLVLGMAAAMPSLLLFGTPAAAGEGGAVRPAAAAFSEPIPPERAESPQPSAVPQTPQAGNPETLSLIEPQSASAPIRTNFEAVDVHVSSPEETRRVLHPDAAAFSAGRYEIRNATMLDLITTAYSVEKAAVFGGPSWLALDRFDVIAKPPAKTTIAAANVMLQSVLVDRFKLAVRKDTKSLPAWVLSAGAGKPKLKPADNAAESACRVVDSNQRLTCTNVTMDAFAAWLRSGGTTKLPVVNSTMIEGSWNFDLHYTVTQGIFGVSENNPIIDALEKEVGLKLEVQNVPQAVLIVEGVNRNPTTNAPDLEKSLPQVRTEFEAASIRPCKAFQPGPVPSREQWNTGCVQLGILVAQAWNMFIQIQVAPNMFMNLGNPDIVGAPNWMNSRFFEIVAKAPVGFDFRGPRGVANFRAMLRNLLVDRFKMVTHYEDRLVDVYTLVAAKPKLKKADPSTRTECRSTGIAIGVPTVVKCENVTMAQFAEELNHQQPIVASGRRVVDSTSIEGSWDFTFSYRIVPGRAGAPGEAADPAGGVSLFDALDQQLGLKLEGAKRNMPVFVIDSIEQAPTEN